MNDHSAESRCCPSCGISYGEPKQPSSVKHGPTDFGRDLTIRENAAKDIPADMLKKTRREEDAVCKQCINMISQSLEAHGKKSPESEEPFYSTNAVTSTLPRSQIQWDETFGKEYQPFMPMAENQPRLTLGKSEESWEQEENDNSSSKRDRDEGQDAEMTPEESVSEPRTDRGNSERPGMLTTDGSMHDLLEVLPRDTNENDSKNFAPWLMARKRLSTQRLRDAGTQNTASTGGIKPYTKLYDETSSNTLIWSDPFAPDLPNDFSNCVGPVTRGCLHPGAVFLGTQRNGQNSYNVSVEITNVDLSASTLGGYLKICGLTKEWPELTTYFDAEIIGNEYSFVTGKWDATEADDIKHWSRFTEFSALREKLASLKAPFDALGQPVIFMRWKEQFLVPDHRVRNINGASFAGFYYICVALQDGDSDEHGAKMLPQSSTTSEDVEMTNAPGSGSGQPKEGSGHPELPRRRRGHMRGFYFHENSEPYQELSLEYVPSRSSGYLEMR